MNKHYLLIAGILMFGANVSAQTLNQSAGWPNSAWSVTGSYSTDPLAFEASPLTTANFAFDDDDAGAAHEDNIAAESPVIDLTPAFNAGEINLQVTVNYGYNYLANDRLRLEYWDAATSAWLAWGNNIPGNSTTVYNNFCTIPKTLYTSSLLNISAFTSAQLTGFRYRISYDDDPAAADYNYGFCFDSPTIKSLACAAPDAAVVSALTHSSATLTWPAVGGANGYEYVLDTNQANPTSGTTTTDVTYSESSLQPQTTYYFHYRTVCASSTSNWVTVSFTTYATPPANDECAGAISLTVNADLTCTATTSGTLLGSTASNVPDNGAGTPDDDVWFKFVATGTTHRISLASITGNQTDLVHEVLSGDCNALTSVNVSDPNTSLVSGLTIGNTYYVRVFSFGTVAGANTTFTVCVASLPAPPANDNCSGAIALTVNPGYTCTTTTPGTLVGATASPVPDNGAGNPDDDVWFSFVATGTTHIITLSNVTGDPTDTVHEVMSGNCGALTSVIVSDNDTSTVTGLTPGNTYYVRVFSYATGTISTTTFNVCVGSVPAPPANDNCSGAIALAINPTTACGVSTTGTLAGSTNSGVAATTGTADDDVWYSFVATATSHTIALTNVTGAPSDLVHQVFSGACGSLVSILSSDPNSSTVTGLTIGNTYYVRVYSYTSNTLSTTNFTICMGTVPTTPPANDECSAAIALTVNTDLNCTVTTAATLALATDSGITATTGTANNDVWFSFVATATSHHITIGNVTGTPTDLVHQVFSGACGSLVSILSSDPNTSIVTGLTPGNTYYVRVYTYSSASGATTSFSVCVGTPPAPPANDECVNAISLNVDAAFCTGSNTNGTNVSATDSGVGEADCFNNGTNDVWFKFTVPATTATVDISTDFTGGTLVDSEIALYSGSCGTLTELDCDQDSGTTTLSNGYSYNSVISDTPVTAGQTYFVRVSGYTATTVGTFCLEITTNETLSSGDFQSNAMKAYPNPVKDVLFLENASDITEVSVFNIVGQKVLAQQTAGTQQQINVSALPNGTYLVKAVTANGSKTIKIVKE